MNLISKSKAAGAVLGVAFAGLICVASAEAAVTEYTSQAAFAAAAPSATSFTFNAGGVISVLPNPSAIGGLSFLDNPTDADAATGGVPLLFLVDAGDTPTYGVDFLSYQNTQVGISAEIDSSGARAIGFEFGSYLPTGDATLELSTGNSFTIFPNSTAQFIGFTSDTPITSVVVDYPNSYAFDLLSVSYAAVPEPATWAMLILGVAMIGFAARRRSEGTALAA